MGRDSISISQESRRCGHSTWKVWRIQTKRAKGLRDLRISISTIPPSTTQPLRTSLPARICRLSSWPEPSSVVRASLDQGGLRLSFFGDILWYTGAGLFPIIDACERLEKLDLTSCRGVRVGDRRRFFEVRISSPGLAMVSHS